MGGTPLKDLEYKDLAGENKNTKNMNYYKHAIHGDIIIDLFGSVKAELAKAEYMPDHPISKENAADSLSAIDRLEALLNEGEITLNSHFKYDSMLEILEDHLIWAGYSESKNFQEMIQYMGRHNPEVHRYQLEVNEDGYIEDLKTIARMTDKAMYMAMRSKIEGIDNEELSFYRTDKLMVENPIKAEMRRSLEKYYKSLRVQP